MKKLGFESLWNYIKCQVGRDGLGGALQKHLHWFDSNTCLKLREEKVSSRSHKPIFGGSIPPPATLYGVYCVRVARQIVVLLVWVRIPLFTPNRELPKLVKGPHC